MVEKNDCTDLTERLRVSLTYQYMPMNVRKLLSEAATTLETLTQENARLREALERIAARNFGFDTPSGIARKALGGGDEQQ